MPPQTKQASPPVSPKGKASLPSLKNLQIRSSPSDPDSSLLATTANIRPSPNSPRPRCTSEFLSPLSRRSVEVNFRGSLEVFLATYLCDLAPNKMVTIRIPEIEIQIAPVPENPTAQASSPPSDLEPVTRNQINTISEEDSRQEGVDRNDSDGEQENADREHNHAGQQNDDDKEQDDDAFERDADIYTLFD